MAALWLRPRSSVRKTGLGSSALDLCRWRDTPARASTLNSRRRIDVAFRRSPMIDSNTMRIRIAPWPAPGNDYDRVLRFRVTVTNPPGTGHPAVPVRGGCRFSLDDPLQLDIEVVQLVLDGLHELPPPRLVSGEPLLLTLDAKERWAADWEQLGASLDRMVVRYLPDVDERSLEPLEMPLSVMFADRGPDRSRRAARSHNEVLPHGECHDAGRPAALSGRIRGRSVRHRPRHLSGQRRRRQDRDGRRLAPGRAPSEACAGAIGHPAAGPRGTHRACLSPPRLGQARCSGSGRTRCLGSRDRRSTSAQGTPSEISTST